MAISRRIVRTSAVSGAAMLAAPRVARAQAQRELRFIPHADLASLDPVWTTADITRNHGNMVYHCLHGLDANFQPHPQMVEGHKVENDGLVWGANAARRPPLPRWREGAGTRLRRLHPALGPARRVRQRDDEPDGRSFGAVGSRHPHSAEEAVRAGACRTCAAELL